jgi:hypothetical protein
MAGILRAHGKPKNMTQPITLEELACIQDYLICKNTLSAIRDNVLLQVGYFGIRKRYEHIRWDNAGIEILLSSSKTDQIHEGQYCIIP